MSKKIKSFIQLAFYSLRIERTTEAPAIISDPAAAYGALKKEFGDDTQENFIILCMDNKNRVLGGAALTRGTASETMIHPRDVFRFAVALNACGIILAHNHPSGILTPSGDDSATTKRMTDAAKIMGIPILDHIIFSDREYYSMKEHGHM